MENRDDKMVALVGLLSAALIAVILLFSVTWFTVLRHSNDPLIDTQSCMQPPPQIHR